MKYQDSIWHVFALIIIMALLVLLVYPVLHTYTLLKAVDASFRIVKKLILLVSPLIFQKQHLLLELNSEITTSDLS